MEASHSCDVTPSPATATRQVGRKLAHFTHVPLPAALIRSTNTAEMPAAFHGLAWPRVQTCFHWRKVENSWEGIKTLSLKMDFSSAGSPSDSKYWNSVWASPMNGTYRHRQSMLAGEAVLSCHRPPRHHGSKFWPRGERGRYAGGAQLSLAAQAPPFCLIEKSPPTLK